MTVDDERIAADFPEQYQPDWSWLESAADENPFMVVGVELFKEAAVLAGLAAAAYEGQPYHRDDAIRCGLLVRSGRLARMTLRDTCDGDGEQQLSLFRQLMDTISTLIYLSQDRDGSRHTAYVQDSLIAERELMKNIEQQQAATGEVLEIENRMRRSIEETAKAAGIDLGTLPSRKAIGWPSAEQRAASLGPTAYTAYRMGSAALHGTWHDLFRNYLCEHDGRFRPCFEPLRPRPQPLFAGALLLVEGTRTYLDGRPRDERELFQPRLDDLLARLQRSDALHEAPLQR